MVRIAPDELSYTTGTAWKKIYGQRFPHEFPKCLDGRGIAAPGMRTATVYGIVTAPHEKHARLRRAIAPAFSERALREQEGFLQLHTDKFVAQLRRACSSSSADAGEAREDVQRWYSLMAFDVVSDLAFGQPAGCLDAADQPWLQVIGQRAQGIVWLQAGLYYRLDGLMGRLAPKKTIEARRKHAELTAAKVAQRIAAQQQSAKDTQKQQHRRRDFMSYILEEKTDEDHHHLTLTELTYMASSFIVAGSGTSASALAGITFLLCRNRDKLARVTAEVRGAFAASSGGDDPVAITVEATARLAYLRAVVDEGMRLYPPSPSTLPRFVPAGGEVVDGRWVPGGTAVGVHQLAAGRMETNFWRAGEFLPERWLVGEGGVVEGGGFAGDDRTAVQPFSYGPRNCIGQK